ncbi:MAG: DUF4214 domain-containing protein, partial [Desulfuromonadales bacterium]|nr:DUF4214 domain-containing protein [Desulfuromonadales bacterium]
GSFAAYADVDNDNTVLESNEDNNIFGPQGITIISGPDLIIQEITANPSSPLPGQSVTVTVTVKNQGDAYIEISSLLATGDRLRVDLYKHLPVGSAPAPPGDTESFSCVISESAMPPNDGLLAPGGTAFCSGAVTYSAAGTFNLWGYVDSTHVRSETAEGNNGFGPKTMTVLAPCVDSDGDGYGSPGNGSCTNGGAADCNDGNAAIHPGAAESCDGLDNNCNGQTNEGFDGDGDGSADCLDNCMWAYNPGQANADGDGYGDACDAGDYDGDGLADYIEIQVGTNVANADTDGDGLKDGIDTLPLVYQTPLYDNTAFVRQVYLDFLNREPDPAGLSYWAGELNAGRRTRAQVVEQYLLSNEFGQTIAPVARLYFAYFLRIPDYGGLMYWVDRYAQGTTQAEISDNFAASAEFQQSYGSLSNAQFVGLIYQNVLGRAPDAGGLAYWTSQLDTSARTRGQVMAELSESAEYRALMSSEVYVTMTYVGLLQRSPDQGGYNYWVGRMDTGSPGLTLIDGFLSSQEYQARFAPD